jgi:hypothetical protein
MHISQDIGSTDCYGGTMRVMHAEARGGLEREAHALKRRPSSRSLSLAVEVSMTHFDNLRRGPNGPKGQRSYVREMARQRVRVRSWGDRGWVMTALARTSAWVIVTADQHNSSEAQGQKGT